MLQSLSIKNVALIKQLNIEFGQGLNILLGETGAGKSIIFDALNFVMGAKADKTLIRFGEDEMRVDAVFTNLSLHTKSLLAEFGFEEDDIGISRSLNIEGRSLIRINGIPASQSLLKEIGKILLDSYSQHESVELLKSKNHLLMLDKYGDAKIALAKEEVKKEYEKYNEILKQINRLGGDEYERERRKSLLEYQVKEISDAKLKVGEDDELSEKLKFFSNSEKIFQAISSCEELLNEGSTSCIRALQQSSNFLSNLCSFSEIEDCKQRLDSARFEIEDIYQTLEDIKEATEFDEVEFERVDKRYDTIKSITKKYGGSIEKTLNFYQEASAELNELLDSDEILMKLEKDVNISKKELEDKCEKLSLLRKEIASDIEGKIIKELQDLGMKSSRFEVKFEKLSNPTSNGFDNVEFVFSANKGQEVKSLAKTASGGELSRFMLAIKNIFAENMGAQTLVFDEIDAGISGETGVIVGNKLNNITRTSQVLCITHLPQVACYGDELFFISKKEENNTTVTSVKRLEGEEIIYNLARMVVGDEVSETALKQAKEMRKRAKLIV